MSDVAEEKVTFVEEYSGASELVATFKGAAEGEGYIVVDVAELVIL